MTLWHFAKGCLELIGAAYLLSFVFIYIANKIEDKSTIGKNLPKELKNSLNKKS